MRNAGVGCVVAVLGLGALAAAEDVIPPQAVVAQYFFVRSFEGDTFDPAVLQENRRAIADLEQAIQKWGRYRLVTREEQADLVFVVRKGSLAAVTGFGSPKGGTGARGFALEAGPRDDYLAVFEGRQRIDRASPLWRRSVRDGLKAPELSLLQAFREAVERAKP